MNMHAHQMIDFDPTSELQMSTELRRPSLGKTPSGFPKLHAEMMPADLIKLIGYDPRTIQAKPRRGSKDPANISPDIIELYRSVQRTIDQDKIDEMVMYLHGAIAEGRYADWAEIDVVTAAKPDLSRYDTSFVAVLPNSADYLITDGQHRFCAVLDFVRRYPELSARFTQAVAISVLPGEKLSEWAGQSFHDKNYLRAPVKATKALASDSRDLHNRLAKELREHPVVVAAGGVHETRDSLSPKAKEFATHSQIYKFVRGFVDGPRALDKGALEESFLTDATYDDVRTDIWAYVDRLGEIFPSWSKPGREDYLFRSSAAIQALGVIGYLLRAGIEDDTKRNTVLEKIGEKKLNWRKKNKQWHGVIGATKPNGEVSHSSSRQAIANTIKFLRDTLGLKD